jgi:hypothetical protein
MEDVVDFFVIQCELLDGQKREIKQQRLSILKIVEEKGSSTDQDRGLEGNRKAISKFEDRAIE